MQDFRSPSLRLRRFASELRRAREAAGFTAAKAAKELGWSSTKVTRMEAKEAKRIKPDDLDGLMDLYGVTDTGKRECMHALAKDARIRGWWSKYKDVFRNETLPDFEAEASVLRSYDGQVIPGLLQTPEYMRALFRGGRYATHEEVEKRTQARMKRREILTRHQPVHLHSIIDESAFQRPIGGVAVMLHQLKYLLHVAQMPHIEVQVLPYSKGAHAGLTAPFILLDFSHPLDTPIVCVPTLTDALYLEECEDVEAYSTTFEEVKNSALSSAESAEYIASQIKTLERPS